MKPAEPVLTVDLFPAERQALLDVLESLSDEEWAKATVCPGWSVHDIALHLLGDDIGFISRRRDKFVYSSQNRKLETWTELVSFLNQLNQQWVEATRRMSPRLLCDFLQLTGGQLYTYLKSLDLFAMGGPVSWAGPGPAPVWLDVAREYTERWLHQQQIRDAVQKPGLNEPRFLRPVLDTFMRALPRTYHEVMAREGTVLQFSITGEAGSEWSLVRDTERWALTAEVLPNPNARVFIDQETTWRLFTKGLSKDEAREKIRIEGDEELGAITLNTVSIIA